MAPLQYNDLIQMIFDVFGKLKQEKITLTSLEVCLNNTNTPLIKH